MNKQKVVVFQGGPVSSDLTFEELARRWEAGLSGLPEVADWEIFLQAIFPQSNTGKNRRL